MSNWREKRSTPQQMLDEVQDIKTALVEAMFTEDMQQVEAKAAELLKSNLDQVLDILDDALYAYIHDTKINEART